MRPSAIILCLVWFTSVVRAEELVYKEDLVPLLVKRVPGILETFDPETGRFGEGIWICRDQDVLLPLAAAYAIPHASNPHHKDPELLETIIAGGDALIEEADDRGKWMFRKKDGSEWGMIWMPWTYSRWVRAFDLIRADMPEPARERWRTALELGYSGIAESELKSVHNIPAHHAMGLYFAGKALDRPEWRQAAADFLLKVVAAQNPAGYWSEHLGPVVNYNFVYADALGVYYSSSRDERVLPALERCADYHLHFTYPDGTDVETIDERNAYHARVQTGNVGFSFTPEGRTYLNKQWENLGRNRLAADLLASMLLYGEEGLMIELDGGGESLHLLHDGESNKALTWRNGPWFVCVSAFHCPVPTSRWIQDRQNFVSIYHEKTGLLVGGGNTKLQPAWSTLALGDPELLQHREGDEQPDFLPKGELHHVPRSATLVHDEGIGLDLQYGDELCRVRVEPVDAGALDYLIEGARQTPLPLAAHLTLLPDLKEVVRTANGREVKFESDKGEWTDLGGWIEHRGARIHLPADAVLIWPALPHNPYRKDGRATPEEGRISIRIPLEAESPVERIRVEILADDESE